MATRRVYKKQFVRLGLCSIKILEIVFVAGASAYVKKHQQVLTGYLLSVFNKLKNKLDHQIKTEARRRSMEKMHHLVSYLIFLHRYSKFFFLPCLREMSCITWTAQIRTPSIPRIFTLEIRNPWTYKLGVSIRNSATLNAYSFIHNTNWNWLRQVYEACIIQNHQCLLNIPGGREQFWKTAGTVLSVHFNAFSKTTRKGDIRYLEGARWSEHFCTIKLLSK